MGDKTLYAGIDAGSRAIKVVLWDADTQALFASGVTDQGVAQESLAEDLFNVLLREKGRDRDSVAKIVATGYGRNLITFADRTMSEIFCHARGAKHISPSVRTVIDIGGQDSKLIRLDQQGSVQDFAMNDRCAAGTGRFLEVVAARLGVELADLGPLAVGSREPAAISSMCVVFAETEIIGLLASGVSPEDIVAGVQTSIAKRVSGMVHGQVTSPVLLTGGVALISGIAAALEGVLGVSVTIPPDPQFAGALGASLFAASA